MKRTVVKKIKIGIASYEDQKTRVMAIARGEYTPKRGEPKIWFTSIESVAQVLSTKNLELLKLIFETEPKSITELAALSGRKQSNLTRTLKTLQRYGLVRMEAVGGAKIPTTIASNFELGFSVAPSVFTKGDNNQTAAY